MDTRDRKTLWLILNEGIGTDSKNNQLKLIAELKRRKVFRVGIAYVAIAWLLVQVAETLLPAYGFGDAAMRNLVAVLAIGLVIALILAWIFEWTPEGVVKTQDAGDMEAAGGAVPATRTPNTVIAVIIVIAAVLAAFLTFRTVDDAPYSDHSIAVLPFSTLGQKEADVFTDGMHVGVLTRLSDVVDLDVISRTSVLQYRNSEQLLPDIASELGAAWVLRGDVQQAGNQVLVSVSLTDAVNDRQVWAEDYQRSFTVENIFDIQADISIRIINELHARLTAEEEDRIATLPTDNLAAYRQYQEGRFLAETRLPDNMRAAIGNFEKALELDPDYALAWAGLADVLGNLYTYRHDTDPATLDRAIQASRRSLELDDQLAEAWSAQAICQYAQRDLAGAIESSYHATVLRPGFAKAHVYHAYYNSLAGRLNIALKSATRAVALDPMNVEAIANFTFPALRAGLEEEATAEALRGLELAPEWVNTRLVVGQTYHYLGKYEEVIKVLRGVHVPWTGRGAETTVVIALVRLGRDKEARELVELILESEDLLSQAVVLAALGRIDEAWQILDSIEVWGDWATFGIRYSYQDVLDPTGEDPRYASLLRQVDKSWGLD